MFNVIINSEQYDEFMAQKEKIKELEARIKEPDELQEKINELENWNNALLEDLKKQRDKNEAQIKECNDLRIKNNELENKVIRFKELVTENYRLKMSINDLKANNKELKAKIKEPVGTITINPCRDSDESYSPDSNTTIKIENLYLTNNYFSEEDENNGGK